MNVCIFNNIFEYLQASPADYEKAVVAAKEAWETWTEVTGINLMLIVCIETINGIFMCVPLMYCKSILFWKLVIGDCPTKRRNLKTNGGGPKAKENTTGKAGKFVLSIYMYSECKNDEIKLLS